MSFEIDTPCWTLTFLKFNISSICPTACISYIIIKLEMHYLTLVHIECCLYIKCRPYTEWHPHYCLVSHGMNTKFKGTIYALWAMEHQECAQIVQQHHSMWFKNTNTGYMISEYHIYAVTRVSFSFICTI